MCRFDESDIEAIKSRGGLTRWCKRMWRQCLESWKSSACRLPNEFSDFQAFPSKPALVIAFTSQHRHTNADGIPCHSVLVRSDGKIDKEIFLLNIFHVRDQRSRFVKVRNKVSRSIAFGSETFLWLGTPPQTRDRRWGFTKFISLVVHKICILFHFQPSFRLSRDRRLALLLFLPLKIYLWWNAGLRL